MTSSVFFSQLLLLNMKINVALSECLNVWNVSRHRT